MFPPPGNVAAAKQYAEGRAGVVAFAVMRSDGSIVGRHLNRTFLTASVVKAMELVAYLRRLDARGRSLTRADRAVLGPMIHISDNEAASVIWDRIGAAGLYAVARAVGMTSFSVAGNWPRARITAADQVRFFGALNSVTPPRFLVYARTLLKRVIAWQAWGIPEIARPDWRVYFKVGCRDTSRGKLVHEAARLEQPGRTIALAVLTDGNPDFPYGVETIRGVTRRLLGINRRAFVRLHPC